jgi:hypothetical protein
LPQSSSSHRENCRARTRQPLCVRNAPTRLSQNPSWPRVLLRSPMGVVRPKPFIIFMLISLEHAFESVTTVDAIFVIVVIVRHGVSLLRGRPLKNWGRTRRRPRERTNYSRVVLNYLDSPERPATNPWRIEVSGSYTLRVDKSGAGPQTLVRSEGRALRRFEAYAGHFRTLTSRTAPAAKWAQLDGGPFSTNGRGRLDA